MTRALISGLLIVISVSSSADESVPPIPTSAQIAELLGIDEKLVSAVPKHQGSKKEKERLWDSFYEISSKPLYKLWITVYPDGFVPVVFLERSIEKSSGGQKIERDDGDVLFFGPGDDDMGTVYAGTLINHENDWDLSLVLLGRDTGVDAPFANAKMGIALFSEIESLLRTGRAEGVAPPSATRSESDSTGGNKPQPESEARSR